ncbi:sensor histidine kinase [Streptomyces sp. SP17BM10]|uniref:sensor histidine kinase n=1 Tax=Streptomyces sp. SP17BM10 TaxID=3002530 RepID=UPI002E77078E|nr:sensor histidine kinase [Streptomyces sp. SP17BM10]MEE1783162.1 sensor histidine kinase [Streptomyces sp. SP17BM10]
MAGLALGAVSACAAPAVLAAGALSRSSGPVVRLAALEKRRVAALLGGAATPWEDIEPRRAAAYLWCRVPVGLLGGGALLLLAAGAWTTASGLSRWLGGQDADGMAPTWPVAGYLLVVGLLLLFLDLAGLAAVAELERRLVHRFLGPDELARLRRRLDELAATRSGIVQAVDAERRRIERDLHDGLQQRLVVVAMLLGRARRRNSDELYRQAQTEAEQALEELRQVAWRVYPASLDELGLREALAVDAERSPLPVRFSGDLARRPAPAVETAAYFAVREALTNAAKHAGATRIDVTIGQDGDVVRVSVRDDGRGGADPAGPGLSGLARRIAALDGHLTVDSPPGGPTHVAAELPCG